MGRKKLNRTKEELDELNRNRLKRYYERHRDIVKQRNLERYYKKMGKKLPEV